jgi:cobyrinic acid a,c-diamide synthase
VRQAIAQACQVPVVGAIPRLDRHPFPERHLGLVPPQEHGALDDAVAEAASIVRQHVDLAALWRVGARSPALPATTGAVGNAVTPTARIGVFRDAAFQFYYEENLEALAHAGGRVIEISPLEDVSLPDVDALYIGGGFPETLAGALADNQPFRTSVREAVARGLPVYAECGGTVYLGKQLVMDDHVYPMAGAFGATFGFGTRPQGHGYVQLTAVRANPFYPIGTALAGHEFHYTFLESLSSEASTFACRVERGHGFDGHSDGLCHRNVLALYTHVHALGTTSWAPGLVHAALRHQSEAPAAGLRD